MKRLKINNIETIEINIDQIIKVKFIAKKLRDMIANENKDFEYSVYIWDFSATIDTNTGLPVCRFLFDMLQQYTYKILIKERRKYETIKRAKGRKN